MLVLVLRMGPDQENAFSDVKEELTKPTILALFDPSAVTQTSPPMALELFYFNNTEMTGDL